jgi:hypothetical protein
MWSSLEGHDKPIGIPEEHQRWACEWDWRMMVSRTRPTGKEPLKALMEAVEGSGEISGGVVKHPPKALIEDHL